MRGFAIHGHGHKALDLFTQMREEGLGPDHLTILTIIYACSHVGLVDEGCKYLEKMKSNSKLEPKLKHYCCLVDLLGCAGKLKEAEKIVTPCL